MPIFFLVPREEYKTEENPKYTPYPKLGLI